MSLDVYYVLFMACSFNELCSKIKCQKKGTIPNSSRANTDLKIVLEESIPIGLTQKSQIKDIG